MVLYTHDSRFLKNPVAVKKVTSADLEPLAERSGFMPLELLRFFKPFQKLANPTTKGLDLSAYSEFMHKFVPIDPEDDHIMQRLFDITNTRCAFYVTFEQCVETLRIIKKGDTVTKAELFFHMADRNNNGYVSLEEIETLVQTKASVDGHFNIVKERRKLTTNKIAASVFRLLDKSLDTRLSHEEFLTAIGPNAEVCRFFDRLGFM